MPDKIKILLTAFSPFPQGGVENISELTLEAFKKSDFYKHLPPNVEITYEVLDISGQKTEPHEVVEHCAALIEKHHPDYVIAMGQEPPNRDGKPSIANDLGALNFSPHYEIVEGEILEGISIPIVEDGAVLKKADFSRPLLDALQNKNPIFKTREDWPEMGSCNAVHYRFMDAMEKQGKKNCTFLFHLAVAYAPNQNPPTAEAVEKRDHFVSSYCQVLEISIPILNDFYGCAKDFSVACVTADKAGEPSAMPAKKPPAASVTLPQSR